MLHCLSWGAFCGAQRVHWMAAKQPNAHLVESSSFPGTSPHHYTMLTTQGDFFFFFFCGQKSFSVDAGRVNPRLNFASGQKAAVLCLGLNGRGPRNTRCATSTELRSHPFQEIRRGETTWRPSVITTKTPRKGKLGCRQPSAWLPSAFVCLVSFALDERCTKP